MRFVDALMVERISTFYYKLFETLYICTMYMYGVYGMYIYDADKYNYSNMCKQFMFVCQRIKSINLMYYIR